MTDDTIQPIDGSEEGNTLRPSARITDAHDDESVSHAMITDDSYRRALRLYHRQFDSAGDIFSRGTVSSLYDMLQLDGLGVTPEDATEASRQLGSYNMDREGAYDEALQFQQQNRPEQYIIRYYIVDSADDAIPHGYKDMSTYNPTAEGEAPVERVQIFNFERRPMPLTESQRQSVLRSFATIESQLPGRFRFEPVTTPEEADITFVRSEAPDGASRARISTGRVVLDASHDNDIDGDHTALHEILHALGVEHPHNVTKNEGEYSVDDTGYLESVMTYNQNDYNSQTSARFSYRDILPVSLMPADMQVLGTLYPIQRDRDGVRVGYTAGAVDEGMTLRYQGEDGNFSAPVYFRDGGLVFQPAIDNGMNTEGIRRPGRDILETGNIDRTPPRVEEVDTFFTNGAVGVIREEYVTLEQREQGLLISTRDSTLERSIENGPAIVREERDSFVMTNNHVDRFELSNRRETLTVIGDTQIFVPENTGEDRINLFGRGNDVHIDIREQGLVFVNPQSTSSSFISLRPEPFLSEQLSLPLIINFGYDNQVTWYRADDGDYRFTSLNPLGQETEVVLRLESEDPLAHARFQSSIDQIVRTHEGAAPPRHIDAPENDDLSITVVAPRGPSTLAR